VAAGEKGIAVGGNVEGGIHYHEAPSTPTLRATPPAPPTHFTGREDDLAKFTQLLTSGQNVAITALQGMVGIGKTALAQKLAECVRDQFPGGVLWWTLGPSADVYTALDCGRAMPFPMPICRARPKIAPRPRPRCGWAGCAHIDDVGRSRARLDECHSTSCRS
jgi:hypothetical protein